MIMGIPNKDEVKGKFDQAKGAIKEKVGDAIDDDDMEAEGAEERAEGEGREAVGKIRRKVGDAISDIGKAVGH